MTGSGRCSGSCRCSLGPFTLEGAAAVAGGGAAAVVVRLVDCSLLSPPRPGPDGRARDLMLESLRAYGAGLLAEAGEHDQVTAALAGYALRVAQEADAGLQTVSGELAAARWLDAEDVTTRQVLAWAREHDADIALRLAVALCWWWLLRGLWRPVITGCCARPPARRARQ